MAKLTPIKAIRKKCLDCCCGQIVEVRRCNIETCALHPYRMGHRPKANDSSSEASEAEKLEVANEFSNEEGAND